MKKSRLSHFVSRRIQYPDGPVPTSLAARSVRRGATEANLADQFERSAAGG